MFCGPLTIIQGHTSHFTVSCMSNFKTRTLVTNFISWVSLLMCVGFYRMCLRNQIQCIALFWRKLLRSAVQKFPEYSLSSEVSVTGSYLEPDESTLNRRTFIWSIIRALFEFIIIVPKKKHRFGRNMWEFIICKKKFQDCVHSFVNYIFQPTVCFWFAAERSRYYGT